jgi:hypothetical protein
MSRGAVRRVTGVLKVQAMAPPYGIAERFLKLADQAILEGPKGTKLATPGEGRGETSVGSARLHVARVIERACDKEWVMGFGLALSEVNKRFGQESLIQEVCQAAGMTVKRFEESGLDEYDLKELKKCLK